MNTISLNGKWKLRWSDGQRGGSPHFSKEPGQALDADFMGTKKYISDHYDAVKWIDAAVPGEVHLDLLEAGIIEDPYVKSNVLKCRWVEEYMWYYRKVFDADAAAFSPHVNLVFEGLDYGAIVYLNGTEVARHENAFYPLIINVSGMLKEKDNALVVRLESGLYTVAEKPVTHLYTATMGIDGLLHKRMWLRKPQSSTEWDWSQRLLNVGIFKDVYIQYADEAVVDNCQVRCCTKKDLSSAHLEARLFLSNYDGNLSDLKLNITVDGNTHSFDAAVKDGVISAAITVENPRLWYPVGYGSQNLYDVGIGLRHKGNTIYSTRKTTGFRYVEIDQSPHPEGGNYFNLLVNGIKVFAKGGNFVPNDMITAAITRERYETLTDLALEANFNFLRVWGGGLYEHDDFFEICDKKGILVWQEFISACATLPYYDQDFAGNVHKEAIYNIRRLSHYPSLIVWCGNNEVDVYGVKDITGAADLPPDTPLYFETLPRLVKEEDPEKYYQPTSPYSFDGSSAASDTVGDQHPWTVGFINKDHREYRKMVCRFPNEGGVLGPASMATIESCLSGNQRYMHSFDWDIHDNMLEGWQPGTSADNNVRFWLDTDPRKLPLEQAVYAAGFVHSEGLTTYIDSFRSKKFTCCAAIFWMYNDCWPCTTSWTIVDYYLRRTPAFHSVKRAFHPVRVIVVENQGKVKYMINSDQMQNSQYVLRYGAFTTNGDYITDQKMNVTVLQNSCEAFAEISCDEIYSKGAIPFAVLYDVDGNIVSANRLINEKYYELDLKPAAISTQVDEEYVTLSSDMFVMGVCFDIDGSGNYEDNIFDLFPGIPYKVKYKGEKPPAVLYTVNELLGKRG